MTVTVQQLARQIRNDSPTPSWVYPLLDRAIKKQSVPPAVPYKLLWAIEAAKSDEPVQLYLAVLNCNVGFDVGSIASWLVSDARARIKYFDNVQTMSGNDLFQYAFERWKNEIGNALVDELIREKDRQNAE